MNGFIVREATGLDFADVASLCRHFWTQTEYTAVEYSEESVMRFCELLLDRGFLFVAESDGKAIGCAGGLIAPLFINDQVTAAQEMFWFILPEYRGSGVGGRLLAAIKGAAQAAGCKYVTVSLLASSPDFAAKIYERAGFRPSDRAFTLELF